MNLLFYKMTSSKLNRRTSNGMTLLEILVVIVILGILIVPISGMIITNINLTTRAKERALAKDAAVIVQQYISNQVKFANDVSYASTVSAPGATTQSIYIDSRGLVHQKNSDTRIIYNQDLLKPYQLELEFKKESAKVTQLTITAYKITNGTREILYSGQTNIKAVNMLTGAIPASPTTGSVIEFVVP